MSDDLVYRFIRIYRDADVDDARIENDLKRLSEFIKHRSRMVKDISYYIVTYARKGESDGLIIVAGYDEEKIDREIDLIIGFIESSLESLTYKIIGRGKNILLPVPVNRNF
jgi:hypothetical protein